MFNRFPLFVKRLSERATLPKKGSDKAAGYDLCSCEDNLVPARGKALVKTGIAIHVPPNSYGRVAPRSGLALKNFIDVGAGVIDEDYRGELGVILFNHSDQDFKVSPGDRIAQLIIETITDTFLQEVPELDSTHRGAGGFGSTGVSSDLHVKHSQSEPGRNMLLDKLDHCMAIPVKRKEPEGGFKTQSELVKEAQTGVFDDWIEMAILDLYNLCQNNVITLEQKKALGAQVMNNKDKRIYDTLKELSHETNAEVIKQRLAEFTIEEHTH